MEQSVSDEKLDSFPHAQEKKEFGNLTVETFSQGKDRLNPGKNEDMVITAANLLAVIDGATAKGDISFGGKTGGQYAAHLVSEALEKSVNLTGTELVDFITEYMERSFQEDGYLSAIKDSPEVRPTASFIAAKFIGEKLILTQVGDVGFRINALALHQNPKEIDAINAQKRKEAIEQAQKENPSIQKDELLKQGRTVIIEALNNQVRNYQNNVDDPLGYGVMDGQKVPPEFVKIFTYDLDSIRFLEIFSDGYFKTGDKPSIESWEDAFRYVEEVDPDKTKDFPSTKGSSETSFTDDRSVLVAKLENVKRETISNPYFETIVLGKFNEGEISVKQNPPERHLPELDLAIEAVWQARSKERLVNGQKPLESTTQLKFKTATIEGDKLTVEVTEGTYKDHIAMQDKDFRDKFPDFDPKIIGTNIVIKTSDGKLLVVQRGKDSATKPGAMSVVGGQWEITKDCDEDGIWDPFKTITRELEEETGVKRDEIENLKATGIIYNKETRNPSIIFYADSVLSSDQIKKRVGDGEVLVKFIPDNQTEIEHLILRWASSHSPSGSSALAIYGRDKFGKDWFDKINNRVIKRSSRLYSKLSPEQLRSINQKASRSLSDRE